ncbi:hypothetical protein [Streptomyces nojiriensis]|uniref:hypothetical protein n=2 Tax=Streptomyces nojiriensis TaxID=66374 RepID=UPI0035DFDEEE
MSTVHELARQAWDVLPALTTVFRFGTAALAFGISASAAVKRIRRRARLAAAATTGSTEASTCTETTAATAEPATITTASPAVGEPPATEPGNGGRVR